MLQKIECIIKPSLVEEVKEALLDIGIHGLAATEVKVSNREIKPTEVYRGVEFNVDYLLKVKIELVLPEEMVSRAVDTITSTLRNNHISNIKIIVIPIDMAVRIRTGELSESAV